MSSFLITALGASAGGIEALCKFFEHTPPDAGIAYVVLLHLSPSHDSQLAQVLQQITEMPVTQVTEKTRIRPDHVYVIPPDMHLTIDDGAIIPSANALLEERRAPVDIFFRSLAEAHGERAVGVVLSGTGANGSMGLKRIKERGGAVFVQNPREAEFNEMPRNAIATDLVDDVMNVAAIPGRILRYRDTLAETHIPEEPEKRIEEDQYALREIFTQLRMRTGHDFSNYKRATLMRRIERRMAIRGLPELPAYAEFCNEHPEETQALLKDLLISVTNFFRDKTPFTALEEEILPAIFENRTQGEQVRIWVAGCATGEEAYTIAMLCAERTLGIMDAPKVQIFATDIDEGAIATAREGYYTLNDAADISAERLNRFFTREGEGFRIRREVRETILFAHHNFLKDPPFSRVDLISCRNVLIYLNRPAQERVMETFHFAIKPGGYLMLGTSESVDSASDLFRPFNREQHIYQGRVVSNMRSIVVPETVPQLRVLQSPQRSEPNARAATRVPHGDIHLQLLEQYTPPSIAVDAEFNIVHVSQRAGRYLEMGSGEPTQAILKLIQDELRAELRNGLYQAAQKGTPVNSAAISVRTREGSENIRIHVRPLTGDSDADARGHLLVVFEPASGEISEQEPVSSTSDETAAQHLEGELARLRAQLRASNEQHEFQAEELKAGNEELQAMNEELRSASEELETSKEELQSINEELSTVNQELKVKVEEATMVSNNLQNLINSTDIGTIFLDRSLRVVLFTPAARSVFNLIPADFGRPLSDITSRLEENTVLDDAQTVLQELQRMERETRTTDGRMLLIRISPYRTEDDRIQGVVISLLDVTERRKADEAIRISEEKYRTLFTNIDEGFGIAQIILDDAGKPVDYRMLEVNRQFEALTGQPAEKFLGGRTVREVAPELEDEWYSFYGAVAVTRTSAHREVYAEAWGRWFEVSAYPVEAPELLRIAILYREITDRKRREVNLAFLANLQTEFAPLASSGDIMRVAGERIAAYFGLTHCLFVEIDEQAHTADVTYDIPAAGAQNLTGRYTLPEFHTDQELTQLGEGQSLVLNDVRDAPRPADMVARFEALGIRSLVTTPFSSEGRWKFALSAQCEKPRIWHEDERNLLEELAARIYIRIERARAEEALLASEKKYRTLFNSIDEGFLIYEVLYDEAGSPNDFRYIETNPAFEQQTGLTNVAGKLGSEVVPTLQRFWFDYFETILNAHEPVRMENYDQATARWYAISSFRATNERPIIAALFNDITERKQREQHQDFLFRLSNALRMEQGADAVANRALEMLTDHLELDRSCITTYHPGEARAHLDYQVGNASVPPLSESFVLSGYPEALRSTFDKTLVIEDALERRSLPEAERFNGGFPGMRAMVVATLRKNNKPLWSMIAVNAHPRHWTAGEIGLVEEVAQRTWRAVEHARAEEDMRLSQHRLESIANLVPDLLWDSEPDGSSNWYNKRWLDYTGQLLEEAMGWGWVDAIHPDDREASAQHYADAVEAGRPLRQEHRIRRYDGMYRWFVVNAVPLNDERGKVIKVYGAATDIHDRKQAEEVLRESESRFRTLADTVPQIIWTNTPDGEAAYFNGRWYEYSGLSYDESRGPGWQAIVHPDDAPASTERWQAALATGTIFDTEYRLRRADGAYRWFIGRNVPLNDKSGQITGWFGSATDIHDLKVAEQALHESRERLRITVESVVEYAIITTNTEGMIEGWNKGAELIFGYTEREVTGASVDLIFTPEDRAAGVPEDERTKARDDGRAEDERWHLRRDGSLFYMSGVTSPIFDGQLKGYVKVARDMTQQKAAEEGLRISEERYRAALQSANMAAWDWNIEEDTIRWNDQHFILLGLQPVDRIQNAAFFLQFIHPDDLDAVRQELTKAVQETGIYRMESFRIVRADGEVRWMTGYGSTIVWAGSKSARMVGVMYDITERKLLEEQKDEFIGIASHELRTPVTSIKAYAEILGEQFEEAGDTRSVSLMNKLDVQVDRLSSLIYALLDTTRIVEGKLVLDRSGFNIDDLIRETAETMQHIAGKHRIELQLQAGSTIHADRERIQQVLVNLMTNAIKYSPKADRIILSSEIRDTTVIVCVQDFGIGISADSKTRVFDRFFRDKDAGAYAGLGLGLFISASIIREHGGRIFVESELGARSMFCLEIPVGTAE